MVQNDKKIINAWCFFDWANSAYSLVITAAIFPIYYNQATRTAFGGNMVSFLGYQIENTVLLSYAYSFSFLIISFLLPMLSGISDYSGKKKMFMRFFTMLGAAACFTLFFFDGSNVELGIFAAVTASIGFAGGLVFYNAFLPEIATPDRYDAVSARGFSMGYFGSTLLLIFNLIMVLNPELFGLEGAGIASKISFITVGIWWIGFSQITFYYLKDTPTAKPINIDVLSKGFHELKDVWYSVQHHPNIKRFLISFFCYSTGVQTLLLIAAIFAEKEIKMESSELIGVVLLLQIVAIVGAFITAQISERKGNQFALMLLLFIWISICIGGYFVGSKTQFYLLAALLGAVMGGVQSLSRATYAKLLPESSDSNDKHTASYFSFYDVLEKVSIVIGTFLNGFITQLSDGNMRNSMLTLACFFIVGALVMSRVRVITPTALKTEF
ncbi:MAG: MFS transporter [Cytophagales bacterium]|nr:MAG: MFS transporter [Cytophagales bacterium]